MRSGRIVAALVLAGILLAMSTPAGALCVNNGTGTPVRVSILVGGTFESRVDPGEMQCCTWEDPICNEGRNQYSSLQFVVTALKGPQVKTGVCRGTIPASYEIQIQETTDNKIRCIGVK